MNEENGINGESEEVLKEEAAGVSEGTEPDADEGQEPKKDKKVASNYFAEFLAQFEQELSPEGKIRLSIDFMKEALASSGTPRFKDFWEGRKVCLPLFKENITP